MPQELLTAYRGYTLDTFQQEAIRALAGGESVLVSAPTGTGKTLIADYLIDMTHRSGRQVVYTAPIKALSNQKFKEFKALLGEEHVGILTGDVVRNPGATVLVMTTEIFRNLLHTDRARLEHTSYVVFDEIHYIDDPVRGSVWEESLIFMPEGMRFLGLSATIPNVDQLARWIEEIHGGTVRVISHTHRAVPLEHHLYERTLGECTFSQLEKRYKRHASRFGVTQGGTITAKYEPTRHIHLVDHIAPDLLPCLFFTFSRRKCEANARELAEATNFLSDREREEVRTVIQETVERYGGAGARSVREIEPLVLRGIAYHHAGLLPVVKDVVEELFERRLVYVLYCTETFAVGLNLPCRTVCFDAITKWDGTEFRALTNREYFQMAGRAGRRGIDDVGFVFTCIDFNFFRPDSFPSMKEAEVEPLRSRFTLSYNTVLNLVRNYSASEIESVLRSNFASYQADEERVRIERELEELDRARVEAAKERSIEEADRLSEYLQSERRLKKLERRIRRKEEARERRGLKALKREVRDLERTLSRLERRGCSKEAVKAFRSDEREYRRVAGRIDRLRAQLQELPDPDSFLQEFEEKRTLLEALDYIRDGGLSARGEFAAQINGSELLVTELFFEGVFHDWEEEAICALTACFDYDPRRGDERPKHQAFDQAPVWRAVRMIEDTERAYLGYSQVELNDHLAEAARAWSEGAPFSEIVKAAGVDEGDLVFGLRRAIDVLRQVRQAARSDQALSTKLTRCIDKMDRDEVSILL